MNAIKIDRNIAIPTLHAGQRKYPFRDMAVGDSFQIPNDARRGGLYALAARHDIKIIVRKDGDALRVWRIA